MAIEIYAITPVRGAEPTQTLHSVAPLEKRQDIELWCTMMNQEANDAGVQRRFKYLVTAVKIWS